MPLQPKQVTALKPLKASAKGRPGSSSKLSKKAKPEGASQGSAPPPSRPPPGGGGGGSGRVHMSAPTAPRAPRLGRPGARSNKNKRLFEGEEGGLVDGQKLFYKTTQVGCVQAGGWLVGWQESVAWAACGEMAV